MIYVTTRQKNKEHQINWLDLIEEVTPVSDMVSEGSAGTITRTMAEPTKELLYKINVQGMIKMLIDFNDRYNWLHKADKKTLYQHFSIPKKTGGWRPIDAPCDQLKVALTELVSILTDRFGLLYHTAAYAYIENRSTVQEVRKHQANESNWFYKTDISGFFPSTTLDFTMKMVSMVFPLSEICRDERGYRELMKALSLGFLNGVLPQGTPLSPMLTNVCCIPIDHRLFNDLAHKRYVYTRYADDIHISCKQKFDPEKMTAYIRKVLKDFGAPWILKPEKTHYGSRKGKNYQLGVCLNATNDITVGHEKKRRFKAMTSNLIMDYKNGKRWDAGEIQKYAGLLSYYKMVERDYFSKQVEHFNKKYGVNLKKIIKESVAC